MVYLCNVEAGEVFFKHVLFDQEVEKVPATHKLQNL
jgi:hypothetical protein